MRRWWWGVNNWAIPGEGGLGCVDAKGVGAEGGTAVGMENEKLAGEVAEVSPFFLFCGAVGGGEGREGGRG